MSNYRRPMPAVGIHPKRVLSPAEQKSADTTAAATAIIREEASRWETKTARLKALRLAKEAESQTQPSPPVKKSRNR